MTPWYTKLSLLDLWVLFAMVSLSLGFLLWKSFTDSKGTSVLEYMVMGRTLTLPMFIASLVATWYSGIFGITQISYEHGVYTFITQGIFWYSAAAIFALFFARKARESAALSLSEYIKHMHGINSGYMTAALILFKTLPIPYAIAIGLFISGFFGIDLSSGIMIGMVMATLYCLKGGMRATVLSDILQFFAMFTAIGAVVFVSMYSFGGLDYLRANLPESHFSVQGNHSLQTVILWLMVAVSTTMLSPVFYQKCFAASSVKVARRGIFISIGFWVISDILTTSAGLYARAAMPDADSSTAFIYYAIEILPDGLRGFFMGSMLITVFSAIDSYLFISSSIITYDLFKKLADSKISRKLCIIITAVLTVIGSTFFHGNIEQVWLITESFFMASMFLPIIVGNVFPGRSTDNGICAAVMATITSMILWMLLDNQQQIEPFFLGFFVNSICVAWVVIAQKPRLSRLKHRG